MRHSRRLVSWLMAAAIITTLTVAWSSGVAVGEPPKPTPNTVSGEAYGVYANVDVLGSNVTVGPTPAVVLPAQGGMDSETLLQVSSPGIVESDTLAVTTTGSIGDNEASAQSTAAVEYLDILNGTITAKLVVAVASSTGNGSSAGSNALGSAFVDLTINGLPYGDVNGVFTPAPNTIIPLPLVGFVVLNEQVFGGNGTRTSSLTVNMIHVYANLGGVQGQIVVSHAHSDVDFAPVPKSGKLFMTGGGRLGTGRDIATFGCHAGTSGSRNTPQGQLQYNDHKAGWNIHSTAVTSFAVLDQWCVTFSGTARVNGVDGYSFTVTEACDYDEPGVGTDYFSISVSGPGLNYQRSGTLTGGNLQLHVK